MLGGLLVWAVHFTGAYAMASVADVAGRADAPAARLAVGGFTAACLLADAILLVVAWRSFRREDDIGQWMASIGALGALFSFVAVAWQGLPALVGH